MCGNSHSVKNCICEAFIIDPQLQLQEEDEQKLCREAFKFAWESDLFLSLTFYLFLSRECHLLSCESNETQFNVDLFLTLFLVSSPSLLLFIIYL